MTFDHIETLKKIVTPKGQEEPFLVSDRLSAATNKSRPRLQTRLGRDYVCLANPNYESATWTGSFRLVPGLINDCLFTPPNPVICRLTRPFAVCSNCVTSGGEVIFYSVRGTYQSVSNAYSIIYLLVSLT